MVLVFSAGLAALSRPPYLNATLESPLGSGFVLRIGSRHCLFLSRPRDPLWMHVLKSPLALTQTAQGEGLRVAHHPPDGRIKGLLPFSLPNTDIWKWRL